MTRLILSAILSALLLAIATPALARPFAPLDVFGLEYASDPQISPDGKQVAYVRRAFDIKTDRGQSGIWVVNADGTGHRPVATGSGSEASPRWSPDGSRLAYTSTDRDGSSQIFVRFGDSGTYARVTNVPDSPTELAWSPDGRQIAFVMRVPEPRTPLEVDLPKPPAGASWAEPLKAIDRMVYRADGRGFLPDAWQQVFVVPADGGTPRQLTSGRYDHRDIAWSADGSRLLLSANRREDRDLHPLDTELYSLDVASGELTALTSRYGPDRNPVVSPDGRRIAWTGFDDRLMSYQRSRLYVMDADGGNPREIAAGLDRDIESPAWGPDGRTLYVQVEDAGRTQLASLTLDGRLNVLADDLGGTAWSRPYPGGSFSIARDGSIAYTRVSSARPADVARLAPRRGPARTLTDLNGELLGQRELGVVERRVVESSFDGRDIEAWVVKPPGFDPAQRYPLILEIHGGPFLNYGPRFAAEMQLYAAAGYVVVYANPRGSTSYGEAFGNLIHHAYPGQDFDDLMSVVDGVIAEDYVDPDRLFVTGGSGGGVLTAWIVGKTQRFRAAAVQKPVINWASFALTADSTNFFSRYWFPAPPWEDPEGYWRRSPLSLVGNVETPTMVVTGELDLRTPIAESEQYYQALRLRGIDTLLVRVPGAYHALDARPSQLIGRIQYILAWFARHDAARPAKAPAG